MAKPKSGKQQESSGNSTTQYSKYTFPGAMAVWGRLGQDPELKWLPSGKALCNMSLAMDYYDGALKEKATCWIRLTTWDKAAERHAEYLAKGSFIIATIDPFRGIEASTSDGSDKVYWNVTPSSIIFGPKSGFGDDNESSDEGYEVEDTGFGDSDDEPTQPVERAERPAKKAGFFSGKKPATK